MAQNTEKADVFIFFADICRSTFLYDHMGDHAAAALVMRALELAVEAVEANNGVVVDLRGDEILCTFDRAVDVFAAARRVHACVKQHREMVENQLAFRIGINFGDFIEAGGNLYGDAVNVASRLASESKAHQNVLSLEVANRCPAAFTELLRPIGAVTIRGKLEPQELFELLETDTTAEITEVAASKAPEPRSFLLKLQFQGRETRLNPLLDRYLLGRGPDCDQAVSHPTISREHAEIRFSNGRFVLIDFSTNGTQVVTEEGITPVHRAKRELIGTGRICMGRSINDNLLSIEFTTDDQI